MKYILLTILILTAFPLFCFADTDITYFSSYSPTFFWETNPSYMVDGIQESYASTSIARRVQIVNNPFYLVGEGQISKVEINACGYMTGLVTGLVLTPKNGTPINIPLDPAPTCSIFYDITEGKDWTWSDLKNLYISAYPEGFGSFQMAVSWIGLQITYEGKSELIENSSTGASFYIEKNISYGDFLNVFFYPSYWSCLLLNS